eukprot:TRINITY_DN8797_c0_g1_i1.p1 TRINITY_DN8797_c0_g1~~TRINITY_DN8797_c0_g1_i1.p1  ORF type:complete len:349 (-),score=119.30 TRINITY_DN8797_c0_g1_i1:21-1016(-)
MAATVGGNEEAKLYAILNSNFKTWIDEQFRKNPNADWSQGVRDYLEHRKDIAANPSKYKNKLTQTSSSTPASTTTTTSPFSSFISGSTTSSTSSTSSSTSSTAFPLASPFTSTAFAPSSSSSPASSTFTPSFGSSSSSSPSSASSSAAATSTWSSQFLYGGANTSSPFGNSLFAPKLSTLKDDEDGDGNGDGDEEKQEDSTPTIVKTGAGEEDEKTTAQATGKAFRFAKENKNWKPLGVCVFKVNESQKDKKVRLLARVEATSLILINTYIVKGAAKAEWADEKKLKLTITAIEYRADAKDATPSLAQFLLCAGSKEDATGLLTAITNALQ